MKVAIAGATGFVGSRLVERLHSEGHSVLVFARNSERARRVFPASAYPNLEIVGYTPAESGDWLHSIAGCDGVVNLAGEPIAEERWTAARQQAIVDSRKLTTAKLVEAIANANPKPSVLVSASAIGYYGTSETAEFDENSPAGDDFLAEVCKDWEAAAQPVKNVGTRLAILRLGIVLGMGGALAKMLPPFKLFAGGPIGTGKQWFSWIHRDDVVNLILFALQNPQIEGVLNATAPNPVRMNELCETLGEVLQRPSWLPVPSFALELLLGDGAKVVLEGQQVLPKQTLASGFQYEYPNLKSALEEILSGS
ncbi:MAG: TIGR01777 family oxidoreductase [Tychonema bourrellyi B0820]|uniref:TIGR01777 family protein n=1 Tax=Tychonema bourrellyi FEM_GT703 TaxID=2040638 RepID=A0A2G4EUJ1_9CYAN|nr:TIGR01777 family oxidoreductase [Tychonema bourrellyi]MDQ2096459.1 TIGR01777 family oxidoreductase [Tychonema bourrellyi B0820]PHX53158.1 TIGR01777 family protein [Tychonema bourrellyi FEM_GT703]